MRLKQVLTLSSLPVILGTACRVDPEVQEKVNDTAAIIDTALDEDTGDSPDSDTAVTTAYVTRGSFWNTVLPDAGYELIPCEGQHFPDVPVDHPYCAAINTAYENGFDVGNSNGQFNPDENMNRAESSKLTTLPYPIQPSDAETSSFDDVDPESWYHPYVEGLNEVGAFRQSSGLFYPDNLLEEDDLGYWMLQLPPE